MKKGGETGEEERDGRGVGNDDEIEGKTQVKLQNVEKKKSKEEAEKEEDALILEQF